MRKTKIIKVVLDIFVIAFLICFCFSLLYWINGSFEISATEEQQEKAKLAAVLLMGVSGLLLAACSAARILYQRNCEARHSK